MVEGDGPRCPPPSQPSVWDTFTDRSCHLHAVRRVFNSWPAPWPTGPPPPSARPSPTWRHTASSAPSTAWACASGPLQPPASPPPLRRRTPWPVDQEKNPASAQDAFSPVAYGARRRRCSTVEASGCRPCGRRENVSAVSCNGVRKRLCLSIQVHLLEPGSPQLPNIPAGTHALG